MENPGQKSEATLKDGTVTLEKVFNAPVGKVWQALTDQKKMKDWYFDIPDFKAEPGAKFSFKGGPPGKQYLHLCKITELVPGRKIAYSWRYDGYPGSSEISFELFAEGEKTRMKLKHRGLDSFPADNPDLAATNFVAGWTGFMNEGLPKYLEKI